MNKIKLLNVFIKFFGQLSLLIISYRMAAEDNHNERCYLLQQSTGQSSNVQYEQPQRAFSTSSEVAQHNQAPNPFHEFAVETNYGVILQAAVFVEDAIKYRSIHHKIDPVTLTRYHRPYYTRVVQWTINIVIAIYLMLAFFEKPLCFTVQRVF